MKNWSSSREAEVPDANMEPSSDPEKTFHYFVNNLAHVCDTQRGGKTVTGLAVLRQSDALLYVYASNARDEHAFTETTRFLTDLLTKVGKAILDSEAAEGELYDAILHDVLRFNSPRIGAYIDGFEKLSERCTQLCSTEISVDGGETAKKLEDDITSG